MGLIETWVHVQCLDTRDPPDLNQEEINNVNIYQAVRSKQHLKNLPTPSIVGLLPWRGNTGELPLEAWLPVSWPPGPRVEEWTPPPADGSTGWPRPHQCWSAHPGGAGKGELNAAQAQIQGCELAHLSEDPILMTSQKPDSSNQPMTHCSEGKVCGQWGIQWGTLWHR